MSMLKKRSPRFPGAHLPSDPTKERIGMLKSFDAPQRERTSRPMPERPKKPRIVPSFEKPLLTYFGIENEAHQKTPLGAVVCVLEPRKEPISKGKKTRRLRKNQWVPR